MRHNGFLYFAAISFAGMISVTPGCDKVDNPFEVLDDNVDTSGLDNKYNDTTWFSTKENNFRSVVIEDYTGQTCGNCPLAAKIAEEISDLYGDSVVIAAIHTGDFASPLTTGDKYRSDYRTPAGEAYNSEFNMDAFGYPNGMINRMKLPNDIVTSPTNWKNKVNELVNTPGFTNPEIHLSLENVYNTESRTNIITIKGETTATLQGTRNMVIWVLESGIKDWQKDYTLPSGQQDIPDYTHKHMLRKAIPSAMGEALIINGNAFEASYSFNLEDSWTNSMSVVAVVYDPATREITQAAEVHVGK